MLPVEKTLVWIGSSYKDLMALPADVRRLFGFALSLAQSGDRHDAAKVLKGFGGAGVLEVLEDDAGGTYRAVYSAKSGRGVCGGVTEMKKRRIHGIKVQRGSGNVFADLGLPDADKLKIKTGLVIEIRKAMRGLDLTQQEAARRMGITQPKVSDMMRGNFANLSERKLMDCLTRLGYDVEISIRPARSEVGHLRLATA